MKLNVVSAQDAESLRLNQHRNTFTVYKSLYGCFSKRAMRQIVPSKDTGVLLSYEDKSANDVFYLKFCPNIDKKSFLIGQKNVLLKSNYFFKTFYKQIGKKAAYGKYLLEEIEIDGEQFYKATFVGR